MLSNQKSSMYDVELKIDKSTPNIPQKKKLVNKRKKKSKKKVISFSKRLLRFICLFSRYVGEQIYEGVDKLLDKFLMNVLGEERYNDILHEDMYGKVHEVYYKKLKKFLKVRTSGNIVFLERRWESQK